MANGCFYSVGVGPGDPELLTFKAAQTIRDCGVIVLPDSGGRDNVAMLAAGTLLDGKRVETVSMPMTRDKTALDGYHAQAAEKIAVFLDEGLSVAFLTIGDPSIYSTAMYVHARIKAMGYETRIIPGVPSFCAAAAALDMPLCEGGEPLHLIPASYGGEFVDLDGTRVLMKSGKSFSGVMDTLRSSDESVSMVERAFLPGERIYRDLSEIGDSADYFSIIVVKKHDTDGRA